MQRIDDKSWPVYTAKEVRQLELDFARETGSGTYPLMEKAGAAAFMLARRLWPWARRWLVLCGKGNNGGDGHVLTRLARQQGIDVNHVLLGARKDISGDAARALGKLDAGVQTCNAPEAIDFAGYDLIIDAMLGTGISGELREPYKSVCSRVNHCGVPILALDIPTGLNSDTGIAAKNTIRADATISFVGVKRGLVTADAFDHVGHLFVDNLGLEADKKSIASWHTSCWTEASVTPPRPQSSHKGMFGHLLVIGGGHGMQGAISLAGSAAIESGAGKVTIYCQDEPVAILSRNPQLMARRLDDEGIARLAADLNRFSALAIGPGLGRKSWGEKIWQAICNSPHFDELPKVIDADALYWLARSPRPLANAVLTPHPGEAAMLLQCSTAEISQNRYQAATEIAQKYRCCCLLKGAGTLIVDEQMAGVVIAGANPELARAGMGDVLTGMIAAQLACGEAINTAVSRGASRHLLHGIDFTG